MRSNGPHITDFRGGFSEGYTPILRLDDVVDNVGMEFGILRLAKGEKFERQEKILETQLVLLGGKGSVELDDETYEIERHDLFRQNAWAFDIPANYLYTLVAQGGGLEFAVIKAENTKRFAPVVVRPQDVDAEPRGKGQAGGTMLRMVKPLFGDPHIKDERFRPPESNLVVGEVVNFSGAWSSYPPHYHPHNEVYYYRFAVPSDEPEAEGWGVSVVNAGPFEVHEHDVVKILRCTGHSQVAAPGYGMWYLWFIRQIEDNRYEGVPPFTFFERDEWIMKPGADEKMLKPEDVVQ